MGYAHTRVAAGCYFSFYYRHLIPETILKLPRLGAFNLHGSLLPKYRGRVPINWAIIHGETQTGATLHYMVAKPDAGDIVDQEAVPIGPMETAREVFDKVAAAARQIVARQWDHIKSGKAPRIPQDPAQASYYGGRKPEDGRIDWSKDAREIFNLVRAVTHPYPGAFTELNGRRLFIWWALPRREAADAPNLVTGRTSEASRASEPARGPRLYPIGESGGEPPGAVVATAPLRIATGQGSLEVLRLQWADGEEQDAATAGLKLGQVLGPHQNKLSDSSPAPRHLYILHIEMMSLKVLILGVNGFIGNSLTERILKDTDWEVYGMDMAANKLEGSLGNSVSASSRAISPSTANGSNTTSRNATWCCRWWRLPRPRPTCSTAARVRARLRGQSCTSCASACATRSACCFPRPPEVYGMCPDREFDEENSNLVLGPINKPRWIYSCSKQLMDRVIAAYGQQQGFKYTLFRPFNWIGPKLDNILEPKEGSSRVLTQFIGNILHGKDIQLVDGGGQRRSFTYIDDGVDALLRIIENKNGCADGRIFNIGNPKNDMSVKELAEKLVVLIKPIPSTRRSPRRSSS